MDIKWYDDHQCGGWALVDLVEENNKDIQTILLLRAHDVAQFLEVWHDGEIWMISVTAMNVFIDTMNI